MHSNSVSVNKKCAVIVARISLVNKRMDYVLVLKMGVLHLFTQHNNLPQAWCWFQEFHICFWSVDDNYWFSCSLLNVLIIKVMIYRKNPVFLEMWKHRVVYTTIKNEDWHKEEWGLYWRIYVQNWSWRGGYSEKKKKIFIVVIIISRYCPGSGLLTGTSPM